MRSTAWFVSGASRGLEIVRATFVRGDGVVAGARKPQAISRVLGASERLLPVALDVTDRAQEQAAVDRALERFGRIDVLVNNAGRGLVGAVEEVSAKETRSVFAVNVDGLLALTRALLPSMRARRAGRIINASSVGGFTATLGFGAYAATKFAVEGLSETMYAELKPLGIKVITVEPGVLRTDFLDPTSLQRGRASSTTMLRARARPAIGPSRPARRRHSGCSSAPIPSTGSRRRATA